MLPRTHRSLCSAACAPHNKPSTLGATKPKSPHRKLDSFTTRSIQSRNLGGPPAVTAYARSIGDIEFRLDRWETDLNTALPGDTRDTSTPAAMARNLQSLVLRDALPPPSGSNWMSGCVVTPRVPSVFVPPCQPIGRLVTRQVQVTMAPPTTLPCYGRRNVSQSSLRSITRRNRLTQNGVTKSSRRQPRSLSTTSVRLTQTADLLRRRLISNDRRGSAHAATRRCANTTTYSNRP